MESKVTFNDIKKLEVKLKEIDDYVKDLYNIPNHKKHHLIRIIREIQNNIEQRVRYITENIAFSPVSVKFPFESFIYKYRAKQGYYESRINDALYRKPGSFVFNEETGKVEAKPLFFDEEPKKKRVSEGALEKKIDSVLAGVVSDEAKRAMLKKQIVSQVAKAREKAGKDYKVKVKLTKSPEGKPKVKIKLEKS